MADQVLHTHAALRLFPPTDKNETRWTVFQLLSLRQFNVSLLGCMTLISFMGGRKISEVLLDLTARTGESAEKFKKLISALQSAGLLVLPDDPKHCFAAQLMQNWAKYGWVEAADYHLATFDYPFIDYSTEAQAEDGRRMWEYISIEPDTNRTKHYEAADERIPAPKTREALRELTIPFRTAWLEELDLQSLEVDQLLTLLAIVFGQLRSRRVNQEYEGRPDLIRKTSPSGGARHPTEGYAVVRDVPGLSPGVYHFAVADNRLERIASQPNENEWDLLFHGLLRAPFRPAAFIIMTSVFERNMYRYREPRTFRTIFMDVGHLLTTLQIAAKGLGLRSFVHHGVHDERLEMLINTHSMSEGVLFGAALAGRE